MICKTCSSSFPPSVRIDGELHNLRNRTNCLTCVPFGSSPYSMRHELSQRKVYNWKKKYIRENGIDQLSALRKIKKESVIKQLGGGCQFCGYNRCNSALTFHHLRDKKFALSEREFLKSWKVLEPEIRKCVLCCHNCHSEIHASFMQDTLIAENNTKLNLALDSYQPISLIHS